MEDQDDNAKVDRKLQFRLFRNIPEVCMIKRESKYIIYYRDAIAILFSEI